MTDVIDPYPDQPDWPDDFDAGIITGQWIGIDGVPVSGSLTITQRPAAILTDSGVTVVARDINATLDADGNLAIRLPATDDPDITPQGWTYAVVENWDGGRSYDIIVPVGETSNIMDVASVEWDGGTPVIRGRQGPPGPSGEGGAISYTLTAASDWNQAHEFPYPPLARFVGSDGQPVLYGVEYPDSLHVYVSFPTPFTGTAILS